MSQFGGPGNGGQGSRVEYSTTPAMQRVRDSIVVEDVERSKPDAERRKRRPATRAHPRRLRSAASACRTAAPTERGAARLPAHCRTLSNHKNTGEYVIPVSLSLSLSQLQLSERAVWSGFGYYANRSGNRIQIRKTNTNLQSEKKNEQKKNDRKKKRREEKRRQEKRERENWAGDWMQRLPDWSVALRNVHWRFEQYL